MPPYSIYSRINERAYKKITSCGLVLICVLYIWAFTLLFAGWIQLYKSNHFISRQCYVKSAKVTNFYESFYCRWNITLIDENRELDDNLTISTSWLDEKQAQLEKQKYKINQTYPCYGPLNKKSIFIQWMWQWNKPSKSQAYGLLFCGITLVFVATVLTKFRRSSQMQVTNTQHRLETLLTSVNRRQTTAPPERPVPDSPPPSYEDAIRGLVERQTAV